jgi:uncharacterized protein YbaR (Trm112 family)
MISPQLLDILRCPFDPANARLEPAASGDGLVCQRCRLKFPVREGIPCMLPEEAELPPGCDALAALPCQRAAVAQGAQT